MKKTVSLIILLVVVFMSTVVLAEEYHFDVRVTGTCDYTAAYEILSLTNQHRARNGLPALTMDKKLLEFAMQRAAENSIVYSHTRPNNTKWYTGYPYKYSNGDPKGAKYENIAIAQYTANSAFTAWKNSSGHNAAMLDKEVKSIGIGAFYQPDLGKYTWVQIFSKTSYSQFTTSGTATKTFTVPVSTAVVNLIIYSPEESILSMGRAYATEEICPGKNAEYGIAAYNGWGCSKIDPLSYTMSRQSGNISVSGNKVTANGEGAFRIKFEFNGVTLTSNDMYVRHSYDPYSNTTKEPTCTENGYSSQPCRNCGYVKEGSIIPAKGHTIKTIPGKDATCVQDGYTSEEACTICHETITSSRIIPATGHNFTEYHPSDALAGASYEKCTYCGEMTVRDPYGTLNGEILEIYERGVTETDRERLEIIKLTYTSLPEYLRERFTNYHILEKMLTSLDGIPGDVNNDRRVNALDATQILRFANNKSSVLETSEKARLMADVNGDGRINALDATQILRYANNKSSVLGGMY